MSDFQVPPRRIQNNSQGPSRPSLIQIFKFCRASQLSPGAEQTHPLCCQSLRPKATTRRRLPTFFRPSAGPPLFRPVAIPLERELVPSLSALREHPPSIPTSAHLSSLPSVSLSANRTLHNRCHGCPRRRPAGDCQQVAGSCIQHYRQ